MGRINEFARKIIKGENMSRMWELLLILVIVFIFFGAGKLPNVMGDIGKSIRNFKKGLKGDENGKKDDDQKDGDTK